MEKKNTRPDVEFISRINKDAKDIIQKMMPMEEMVLGHTMFPYYRFAGNARISNALWAMSANGGDAHQLLPVFKGKHGVQARHIKYCPECASESREAYGEAYWDRKATIRNIGICPKHKCRLEETSIEISAKQSPRLYVAEGEIKDTMPELAEDGLGFQLAEYMLEVFQSPIDFKNGVPVGISLNQGCKGPSIYQPGECRCILACCWMTYKIFIRDYREQQMEMQEGRMPNIRELQKNTSSSIYFPIRIQIFIKSVS